MFVFLVKLSLQTCPSLISILSDIGSSFQRAMVSNSDSQNSHLQLSCVKRTGSWSGISLYFAAPEEIKVHFSKNSRIDISNCVRVEKDKSDGSVIFRINGYCLQEGQVEFAVRRYSNSSLVLVYC